MADKEIEFYARVMIAITGNSWPDKRASGKRSRKLGILGTREVLQDHNLFETRSDDEMGLRSMCIHEFKSIFIRTSVVSQISSANSGE